VHAVTGKPAGQQPAERVGREPAEEPRRVPEPGDCPGGIERAAAWAGADGAFRLDDQVDEAFARNQESLNVSSRGWD
jgi:hypothetical protein